MAESQLDLNYYQKTAINHSLRSKNKGLLVFHQMGTGKTLTGSFFLLNYNKKERVVICPEVVKYNWTISDGSDSDATKASTKIKEKGRGSTFGTEHPFNILTFEDLVNKLYNNDFKSLYKTIKEKVIVIDEAHLIIGIINNNQISNTTKEWFYNLLRSSKKIMLLTGTPFYYNIIDIAYLINLCPPKLENISETIIPFNEYKFRKNFYKTNFIRKLFIGYIVPILDLPPVKYALVLLGTFAFVDFAHKSQHGLAAAQNSKSGQILNNFARFFGTSMTGTGILITGGLPLLLTLVLLAILSLIKKYWTTVDYLDTKKLGEQIGDFISYYSNESVSPKKKSLTKRISNFLSRSKRKKKINIDKADADTDPKNINFKNVIPETVYIPYSSEQLQFFLDLTIQKSTEEELEWLNIDEKVDLSIFKKDIFDYDYISNHNDIVPNISIVPKNNSTICDVCGIENNNCNCEIYFFEVYKEKQNQIERKINISNQTSILFKQPQVPLDLQTEDNSNIKLYSDILTKDNFINKGRAIGNLSLLKSNKSEKSKVERVSKSKKIDLETPTKIGDAVKTIFNINASDGDGDDGSGSGSGSGSGGSGGSSDTRARHTSGVGKDYEQYFVMRSDTNVLIGRKEKFTSQSFKDIIGVKYSDYNFYLFKQDENEKKPLFQRNSEIDFSGFFKGKKKLKESGGEKTINCRMSPGLIRGNFSKYFKDNVCKKSKKKTNHIKKTNKKQGKKSSGGNSNKIVWSPKFEKIYEKIMEVNELSKKPTKPGNEWKERYGYNYDTEKGLRIVVYSSFFISGIVQFERFLREKQEKTSNNFKICYFFDKEPDNYDILLLRPDQTVGINIPYANEFHIMEQIQMPALYEQVKARVVRGLKPGEINVKTGDKVYIYTYECKLKNVLVNSVGHWFSQREKNSLPMNIFWKRFKLFDQDITPDTIIKKKRDEFAKNINSFQNNIVSLTKDHQHLDKEGKIIENRSTSTSTSNDSKESEGGIKMEDCLMCQNGSTPILGSFFMYSKNGPFKTDYYVIIKKVSIGDGEASISGDIYKLSNNIPIFAHSYTSIRISAKTFTFNNSSTVSRKLKLYCYTEDDTINLKEIITNSSSLDSALKYCSEIKYSNETPIICKSVGIDKISADEH